MKRRIPLLLCMCLLFVGCGNETDAVPTHIVELPKEEQILVDTYELSSSITDNLTKSTYYLADDDNITIIDAYDPMIIQVDCMELFEVGKTRMGEIASAIDEDNKITLETITEQVRSERQAILDEEYENGKKTGEKPEADISDLNYTEPYRYAVIIGDAEEETEYEGTYLIDPSTDDCVRLLLYKYGIPYVEFEFSYISDLFNERIKQESDWILTAVESADMSEMFDEDEEKPSYVGSDGKCTAKQNIKMSGDINFAGDGFDWDSLKTLFSALALTREESSYSRGEISSYIESSDEDYTYYTITLACNLLITSGETGECVEVPDTETEIDLETIPEGFRIPNMSLIATFDRHTQKCINWRVEMIDGETDSTDATEISKTEAELVNIKQYKTDTTDYAALQEKVDTWVKENASQFDEYGYYLISTTDNSVIGRLDSGLFNLFSNVTVDGIGYSCLACSGDVGTYISSDNYAEIANAELTEEEYASKIAEASFDAYAEFLFVNQEDKEAVIMASLNDDMTVKTQCGDFAYTVYNYAESEDRGITEITIIDSYVVEKLGQMYIMAYNIKDTDVQNQLIQAGQNNGIEGYRAYVEENIIGGQ